MILSCPSHFGSRYDVSLSNNNIIVGVADNINMEIPVYFRQTTINSTSVQKFRYPLRTPPPNKIQDTRTVKQIYQDMLGILSDTPKLGYKFYMDLLLKRDSSVPEIDETGVELSTELIKKAIKEFKPTLTKMKDDYLSSLKESVIIQNVNLNLPASYGVPPGPLMFARSHSHTIACLS